MRALWNAFFATFAVEAAPKRRPSLWTSAKNVVEKLRLAAPWKESGASRHRRAMLGSLGHCTRAGAASHPSCQRSHGGAQ